MKEFRNPKINIFMFTKEDIITTSTEPGAGLEGGTLLSTNPETAQEVNIGTITK